MTRRELLAMSGGVAAAGCRGAQAPASDTRQQSESATVTLIVAGMI